MTDRMAPEARSRVMRAIRGKWTVPELEFKAQNPAAERGEWLPHRPDFVLGGAPVYVEGSSFWRGDLSVARWAALSPEWEAHLFANRVRDASRHLFWDAVGRATGMACSAGGEPMDLAVCWSPGEGLL